MKIKKCLFMAIISQFMIDLLRMNVHDSTHDKFVNFLATSWLIVFTFSILHMQTLMLSNAFPNSPVLSLNCHGTSNCVSEQPRSRYAPDPCKYFISCKGISYEHRDDTFLLIISIKVFCNLLKVALRYLKLKEVLSLSPKQRWYTGNLKTCPKI